MNKKVLVSILAMTSAPSLTAWANANLDYLKTNEVKDWTGATDKVTLDQGVIVSADGTTLSQKIGTLYKGDYVLTVATAQNVIIKVNGTALATDGKFSVKEKSAAVTVTLEAKEAGKEYQAGNFKLELVYDFDGNRKKLETKLSEVVNKINKGDDAGKALLNEATVISKKIALLVDDKTDATSTTYTEVYCKYKLYEGLESCTIAQEIDAFKVKVEAQANNTGAYLEAKGYWEIQEQALKQATDKLAAYEKSENADEKAAYDYATGITKGRLDAANKIVGDFKAKMESAYKAGTAGAFLAKDDKTFSDFNTNAPKAIRAFADAVNAAPADHKAYLEVNKAVGALSSQHNDVLLKVTNALKDEKNEVDVYEDLRQEAREELNAILIRIRSVQAACGTEDNHEGAAKVQQDNSEALNGGFREDISQVESTYTGKAKTLISTYHSWKDEVASKQATLDELNKVQAVKDKHEKALTEIQGAISALDAKVEAANGKHEFADYTEDLEAIQKLIDTLNKDAAGDIANYKAYEALGKELAKATDKLTEAKKAVAALKSKAVKDYTTEGKYTDTEASLQKKLDDIKAQGDKDFKESTCVGKDYKVAEVETEIDAYRANAETTAENVTKVYEALAKCDEALKALTDKVGANTDVEVAADERTYGDHIQEFETSVKSVRDQYTKGMEAKDADHVSGLAEAVKMLDEDALPGNLVGKAKELMESFDADKETHDKAVVEQAVNRLHEQALALISTTSQKLEGIGVEGLGLSKQAVLGQKDAIQQEINEQESAEKKAYDNREANMAAAMSGLSSVKSALEAIDKKIESLKTQVKGIQDAVKANEDKYASAEKEWETINKDLNKVTGNNKDASRADEFANKKTTLSAAFEALKADVRASYGKETLVKDWADTKADGDTKAKSGYGTRIQNLKADIDKAQKDATASTDNYNSYTKLENALTDKKKVDDKFTAARNALTENNYAENTPAYTHYTGVIDGYEKELTSLKDKAKKAYDDRKCKEQEAGISASLNSLLGNVNGLSAQIKLNKVSYDDLVKKQDDISKKWSDVYYVITTTDKTTQLKEYQKQMSEVQGELTDLQASINSSFGKGEYGTKGKYETDNVSLDNLNAIVLGIEKTQAEDYNKYVALDNTNRHEAFLNSLQSARKTYSDAILTIGKFSSLTNKELVSVAADAISDANKSLSGILTELRQLEVNELEAYSSATGSTLFDVDEKYQETAVGKKQGIEEAIAKLDGAVSGKARELYSTRISDAQTAYKQAVESVQGFDKEALEHAQAQSFGKANDIITKAQTAQEGKYFALTVDEHLTRLEGIDALLKAGQEEASAKEWEIRYDAAQTTKDSQLKEMNAFEYIPDAAAEKQTDIDDYEAALENLEELNSQAQANKVDGVLFENIPNLKDQLQAALDEADDIYQGAKQKSAENGENIKAFNAVTGMVASVQGLLDAAQAYTQAYAVTYGEMVETIVASQQTLIDAISAELDYARVHGGCVSKQAEWEARIQAVEVAGIPSIYTTANEKELAWLNSEAENLKGDQNKAAQAVEGTDKATEVDGYLTKIADLQTEITKWSQEDMSKKKNEDIQKKNLELEGKVAAIRFELSKYYDGTLEASTYDELNASLATVRTDYEAASAHLAACNQKVQDEFEAQMAGVAEAIKSAQANLDAYKDASQTLLYKGKAQETISRVAKSVEALAADIQAAQAPYTANEEAYTRLAAELDGFTSRLHEVTGIIKGYTALTAEQLGLANKNAADIQKQIDGLTEKVTKQYESETVDGLLKEDSQLPSNTVVASIEALLADNTYYNNYSLIEALHEAVQAVEAKVNGSGDIRFTDAAKMELTSECESLASGQEALATFNVDAKQGYVLEDIYGNEIKGDEDKQGRDINYMDEAAQLITSRLAELQEAVDALDKKADEKAYVLGDIDRDKKVEVNDYMAILNIVTGKSDMPTKEEDFLAADANGDGRVDIGDVIVVVNKVLGIKTGTALRKTLPVNNMKVAGEVQMAVVQGASGKRVAIKVHSANQYVGCQMDVNLPTGVTVLGESIEGMSEHRLYTGQLPDGTLRLVVSSLENAVMDTEGNATIYLDVEGNRADEITVSGVTAADAAGTTYSIVGKGEATGIGGLKGTAGHESLMDKVYNVGGQLMDSVKKGINIIRNTDGSARKVLKK